MLLIDFVIYAVALITALIGAALAVLVFWIGYMVMTHE